MSSVSSVSSLDDLSEDANDSEEDADDEEERPSVRAPSYGRRDKAHKTGPKPAKRAKKMRMTLDDDFDGDYDDSFESSDDVYAAVDYISDGDDEEQDVEKLEELLIVESEKEDRVGGMFSAPESSSTNDWAGSGGFGDHMLLSTASFFDEDQLYGAMENFGETDLASETAVETPMQRRVHFEEHSDSSSDSDSHTDDEIPGDFLQQDSLDPQLRRMIESDNENSRHNRRQSDEMFADSDYGHSNIYHVESDAHSEKSESSGYESMLIACTISFVYMLTHSKPMMVKPQTKTSLLPLPSHTHGPSSAVTPLLHWLPPLMKRVSPPLAGVARSWEHLLPTLTSQLPWWTALASTW